MEVNEIRYLNTDLDLYGPRDLAPLAAALKPHGVFVLYISEQDEKGVWMARCETETSFREPDQNIAAMLNAIESFDDETRSLWNACTIRDFNIGYDCGDKPWAFHQEITSATLGRVAAAGAAIVITIYPVDPDHASQTEGLTGISTEVGNSSFVLSEVS